MVLILFKGLEDMQGMLSAVQCALIWALAHSNV